MDMFMAARRFDLLTFEQYDFSSQSWTGRFKGQLKVSDKFASIYHRPTRKAMLYVEPRHTPTSSVIRVRTTGEIFMVGALQQDAHANVHYRDVRALHRVAAEATIVRRRPVGPPNNPGWAVPTTVQTTWADVEMRSLTEDEEASLYHHGHVFLVMPSNSPVQPHDTVTVGGLLGQSYYVLERYVDSALITTRAVARGDERRDIVYREYLSESYNPGTATVTPNYLDRNVTARISPLEESEGQVTRDAIKMMVATSFIGIEPKLRDRIVYQGKEYSVYKIDHDPLEEEYRVWANV